MQGAVVRESALSMCWQIGLTVARRLIVAVTVGVCGWSFLQNGTINGPGRTTGIAIDSGM
ncbi:hypothetical protein GCM10010841_33170 [Deinococcus aerophilus]|uniref:Uncharacterized protein n=1 Tax=Deinococcus aerophilus TaxID=522488 RepID=A0ABQ2H085_9DEIO|nr:hypothetical protein GCM10010841_33170 [Deinococcus aerophilus]